MPPSAIVNARSDQGYPFLTRVWLRKWHWGFIGIKVVCRIENVDHCKCNRATRFKMQTSNYALNSTIMPPSAIVNVRSDQGYPFLRCAAEKMALGLHWI
jgi:hypothetical protein